MTDVATDAMLQVKPSPLWSNESDSNATIQVDDFHEGEEIQELKVNEKNREYDDVKEREDDEEEEEGEAEGEIRKVSQQLPVSNVANNTNTELKESSPIPPSSVQAVNILIHKSAFKTENELKTIKASIKNKKTAHAVAQFYHTQNQLITSYLQSPATKSSETVKEEKEGLILQRRKVNFAMYASVTSNFVLCGLQLFVAFNSRSLSLFAAMTDTFMDLASDAVLVFATVTASKENLLRYPTGKQRFQTAAVVVFSCIMGAFSVELMIEAGKSIVSGSTSTAVTTNLTIVNMSCLAVLIVVKSVLYLYCCTIEKSPTATVLAQHHRNDIILNIAGITLSIFGNQVVWWIDPVGGILIALWILVTWGQTAFEYVQKFVGESAPQAFLNKITYLSINHHNVILKVNAVRAYSSGAGYFVEVEIVMDPNTRLDLAQEIASTLKHKIEAVDDVERAFVHFPSATV